MGKIKKIFLALVTLLFLFRLWQTTGCKNFTSFYFNPISIKISAESHIALDKGISRNISRFFHNKVSVGVFEFSKSYFSAFSSRYLLEILSPLGVFLLGISVWSMMSLKNKTLLFHFAAVLISALFGTIVLKPQPAFYLFSLSLYSFSINGLDYFVKSKFKITIFILLTLFSFWYFIFNWQMASLCNEIIFK